MIAPPSGILVLTAPPGAGALTGALAEAALAAASVAGARPLSDGRWLSQGAAWEADLEIAASGGTDALVAAVERALAPAPVDVNVVAAVPGSPRRKRLLCADMESTIIAQELLDEMAGLAGRHEEIASITAAAMRGELDFEASLRRRVALLAGFPERHLGDLLARITPMPGAEALVRTLKAGGARTALVTGGFTCFAEPVAARLGFDTVVANVLDIEGGVLTGRVRDPIVDPHAKARALTRLAAADGLALSETVAVGDGANDALMLEAAGLGVAFRAKPALAAQARRQATGAVIAHGDLTALLHLMDYAAGDIGAETPAA